MTITVVFDPPLPSDSPATFNTKAFSTLGDLNGWSTEANALAATVNSDASSIGSAATTATTQAGIATTQAGNASTSASTATTQAGIATTMAGVATTQAGNAATSASAAYASELAAAASAAAAAGGTAVEAATHAAASKATPVDADELPLVDSAASWGLKKLTWANLKATARTYFDTLYTAAAHAGSTGAAHGNSVAAGAAGFMTGADKSKLDGISGTNTGDETGARIAALNHAASVKSALVDADEITGQDSASSFGLIRSTWASVKAFLKTYFDTLYAPIGGGGGGLTGFRNRIINGDMRIDQRNAGTAITRTGVSVHGEYPVGRMIFASSISGTVSTVTQQVADAPPGFLYSAKITCTTANSGWAANDTFQFRQRIEAFNVADIRWLDGTNRYYVTTYTISLVNTWEYKTVTIPAPVSGSAVTVSFWVKSSLAGVFAISMNAIGTTTTGVLAVNFDMGHGSTYQTATPNTWGTSAYLGLTTSVRLMANTGATWQVTGLQLEPGSTATTFEQRPYGTELALLNRYARKQSIWVGTSTAVSGFPIGMRATPTITGGGAGFTSTGTTADTLMCYQTTGAAQTLILDAEL